MNKKELNKKTKKELLELSRKMKIVGRHALKKAELVKAMLKYYASRNKELTIVDETTKKGPQKQKKDKIPSNGPLVKNDIENNTAALNSESQAEIRDTSSVSNESQSEISDPSQLYDKLMHIEEGKEESLIRSSKYDTGISGPPSGIDEDIFLPSSYLKSHIHLLVKNPKEMFTYWDLLPDDINSACKKLKQDISLLRFTIRVYDVTKVDFKGDNANSYFDVHPGPVNRFFIKVPASNCNYCVEIGLKSRDGFFMPIARSNTQKTPKDFITYGLKWKTIDLSPIKKQKQQLKREEHIGPLIELDSQKEIVYNQEHIKQIQNNIENIQKGTENTENKTPVHRMGKDDKTSRSLVDGGYCGSTTSIMED